MAKKKNSKGITAALAALEKRFGEPVVMRMDEKPKGVRTISTGRPSLDSEIGGGYARGGIIEIYGEEATGKTGLALDCAAHVQQNDGLVGYIDTEHALDVDYCEQIGVNIEDLLFSQPDYGEQAFQILRTLLNTGELDLIIVDSVAAMIPKAELEGETGESKMGLHARMMSQGLKQIIGAASESNTTIIFINQLRDTFAMYGAKKKPTGGNSLKFYAKQRFEIKNKGQIKVGEDVIGFKQQVRAVKNKIAPPFKIVEEDIVFGKGIDKLGSKIDAFIAEKIIEKKGAWFSYEDTNLAQGLKKLRILLEENPDLMDVMEKKLKDARK